MKSALKPKLLGCPWEQLQKPEILYLMSGARQWWDSKGRKLIKWKTGVQQGNISVDYCDSANFLPNVKNNKVQDKVFRVAAGDRWDHLDGPGQMLITKSFYEHVFLPEILGDDYKEKVDWESIPDAGEYHRKKLEKIAAKRGIKLEPKKESRGIVHS